MLGLVKISSGTIYANGKSISDKKIKDILDTLELYSKKMHFLIAWQSGKILC